MSEYSIQAHDAGFDETSFLSWAEQVHFAVITALNDQQPEALRQYVADSLYPRLAAQISQAQAVGGAAHKLDPNSERPTVIRADSDASYDTIVVRLYPPSQQQPHLRAEAVDWTFQRSSHLSTTPGPLKASTSPTCPSCGAPLQLDANGLCVYCKAPAPVAKFDWLLVAMEPAGPDPEAIAAAAVTAGRRWIGITVGLIVLFAVGLPIAIALLAHSSSSPKVTIPTFSIPSFTIPNITIPDINIPTAPKTLTVELTLNGAEQLSPSTLDMNDLSLNGGHFGDCPTSALTTIGLNVTFDDGDQLQGTFTLPTPATPGATVDLGSGSGGSVKLHQIGASGAAVDDQTWSLPAGKTGAVTVLVDASGGGTLTWRNLPSGEPSHNDFDPFSGTATWTCD